MLSDTRTLSKLPQRPSPRIEREQPDSAVATDRDEGARSRTIPMCCDCKIIAVERTIPASDDDENAEKVKSLWDSSVIIETTSPSSPFSSSPHEDGDLRDFLTEDRALSRWGH